MSTFEGTEWPQGQCPERTLVSPEVFEQLLAELEEPPVANERIRRAATAMGSLIERR